MQEDSSHVKRASEVHHYEFYSEGPKGSIKKVVQFQLIDETNYVFNLAFGDWEEEKGVLDDKISTNNHDGKKFSLRLLKQWWISWGNHPTATVFAKGSTASRTRLYQME